jgi:hypothetical protein
MGYLRVGNVITCIVFNTDLNFRFRLVNVIFITNSHNPIAYFGTVTVVTYQGSRSHDFLAPSGNRTPPVSKRLYDWFWIFS